MGRKGKSKAPTRSPANSQLKPSAQNWYDSRGRSGSGEVSGNGYAAQTAARGQQDSSGGGMREAQRLAASFFNARYLGSPDAGIGDEPVYDRRGLVESRLSGGMDRRMRDGHDRLERVEYESGGRGRDLNNNISQSSRGAPILEPRRSAVETGGARVDYENREGYRKSKSRSELYLEDEREALPRLDARQFLAYEEHSRGKQSGYERQQPFDEYGGRETGRMRHADYVTSHSRGSGNVGLMPSRVSDPGRSSLSSYVGGRAPFGLSTYADDLNAFNTVPIPSGLNPITISNDETWHLVPHQDFDQIFVPYADLGYQQSRIFHGRDEISHLANEQIFRRDYPSVVDPRSGMHVGLGGVLPASSWSRFPPRSLPFNNGLQGTSKKGKRRSWKAEEAPFGKKMRQEREADRLFQMHNNKASTDVTEPKRREGKARKGSKSSRLRRKKGKQDAESDWDDDAQVGKQTVGVNLWEQPHSSKDTQPSQNWEASVDNQPKSRVLTDEEHEIATFAKVQAAACRRSREFLEEILDDDADESNDEDWEPDNEGEYESEASDLDTSLVNETETGMELDVSPEKEVESLNHDTGNDNVTCELPAADVNLHKKTRASRNPALATTLMEVETGDVVADVSQMDPTMEGSGGMSEAAMEDRNGGKAAASLAGLNVEGLQLNSAEREERAYEIYSAMFRHDSELKRLYEAELNCGSFECLVCAGCGAGGKKRFSDVVSLVQHAKKVMKTKRRPEHRGYARSVIHMLAWETSMVKHIVPRGCIPPSETTTDKSSGKLSAPVSEKDVEMCAADEEAAGDNKIDFIGESHSDITLNDEEREGCRTGLLAETVGRLPVEQQVVLGNQENENTGSVSAEELPLLNSVEGYVHKDSKQEVDGTSERLQSEDVISAVSSIMEDVMVSVGTSLDMEVSQETSMILIEASVSKAQEESNDTPDSPEARNDGHHSSVKPSCSDAAEVGILLSASVVHAESPGSELPVLVNEAIVVATALEVSPQVEDVASGLPSDELHVKDTEEQVGQECKDKEELATISDAVQVAMRETVTITASGSSVQESVTLEVVLEEPHEMSLADGDIVASGLPEGEKVDPDESSLQAKI